MQPDLNAAPINPLPMIVWVLALPIVAMELVLALAEAGLVGGAGGIGWRLQAVERFGMFPELLRRQVETGGHPYEELVRLVAYPLVHGSFTHALFAVVILLALGKMVGEIFRWWAVALVFFGSGVVAALVYSAIPMMQAPLVGGYPATYGLIGAFTFLLWVRLTGSGDNQWRAFTMIGFLLGAQLLFGLLFGGGTEWVADIAGFATGFLLSFVVSPGGIGRALARLRTR